MARKPPSDHAGAAPDGLSIDVLGGFRVRVDGREVGPDDWPSLRAAQLVQLLSLAEGHRLVRDQVVDTLWPQLDPEAGRANLRKAAHHARQAMGLPDAIALQGGQVVLCPSKAVSVDAARFERLAAAALAARDPAACAAAADAYGGDLLPGSRYEEWAEAARDRLRSRHLELLRASARWERLAQFEPTDETAHRELMRRALAAGNRPEAIRWYAHLRGALQQTLGILPDRETEALYEQCVSGLGFSRPALVGRHLEIAQATAWMLAPPEERPGGLLVRGPAGIGKSAFCRELRELARERGWTVVGVDAVQAGRPYAVVSTVLDQLIGANRSLLDAVGAPARSALAMLSPLAAPAAGLQGPLGRHQVIGAFRRLLLAASGQGPVVVQVDDAHLVGEADADVLIHLIATGRPVAVVLAMRPPSAHPHLDRGIARLARGNRLATIELGPLADADAAGLVAQAAPAPLDAALVDRIVRLADGNPFAALELARAAGPQDRSRLPANAREAITARLCDVDEEALSLLESLALASDELDTAMVLALAPGTEAQTFALLDLALAAGVLVVAGTKYRFRHELVRQALVEQLAPHRRLKVHREAARRLASVNAPPAMIAHHLLAGGSLDEATNWLLAAARDATRLGAFPDALRHLKPLLAHEPGHVEALRLRAEALDATGDPATVAAYRAAAAAAGEPGSHDLLAKGALAQVKMGDPKGALAALEGVRPTTVEGRLAEALTLSGSAALGFGDPALGTAKAAESRRLALQTGDTASIVVASWAQAAAAHARGDLHGSVWADLHETHHVPHLAVRVFDGHLCITQRFLYGSRPYPEVIAFADAIAEEATRLGAARGRAFGVTLRGEAELLTGHLDAAEEHLTLGGRLQRAVGGATGEALTLQRRAELAMYRGRRDLAADLLDEALDLARQTDIGFHLLDRIYGARVSLAADPAAAFAALEDAQDAVRGPLETCPGCRITFAVPAAIAAARAGRLDVAAEYEKSVAFLANVVMRLPAWYAAHEEVRAQIALAQGDKADAAARFAAAARGFRAAGQPLDAARCERNASP
jgi:DNA-binding SARP family transcriptional activator